MPCAKFGWNGPSDSWEDENVKSLQQGANGWRRQRRRRQRRRIKDLSEKLSCNFYGPSCLKERRNVYAGNWMPLHIYIYMVVADNMR